ncbi:Lactose permease [Colletotrichum sidae]|uniref:Lactose permease n=1 Tax=Colletotrichum sidae TaxID=1347389 RepID=A0A4V3I3C7_9PEZI|nr:Lactose permease [Colletotrichum sidae]
MTSQLGIGSMLVIASCPVLLTEPAHPRQRSFLVSSYASLFFIGSITWTSFGTLHIPTQWSWRIPTTLQLLPPALQLPLITLVPESPRWLVSHSRHSEARSIIARFHANNDANDPIVSLQYYEIHGAIALSARSQSASYLSFLQSPGNRRRLLLVVFSTIFGSWSGNGIITVYLSTALKQVGITDPAAQAGINGGLQIFNFCVALAAAALVDRLDRRVLFVTSSLVMLLAMTGFTVATEQFARQPQAGSGKALVAMVFLFQFGSDVGFTPLTPMYTAEICPYHLRAKAMALHYFLMYAFSAAGKQEAQARVLLFAMALQSVASAELGLDDGASCPLTFNLNDIKPINSVKFRLSSNTRKHSATQSFFERRYWRYWKGGQDGHLCLLVWLSPKGGIKLMSLWELGYH